jgi:hypothetical protein
MLAFLGGVADQKIKISQKFSGSEKLLLVGVTCSFENAFQVQISSDIYKLVVIGETTIYGICNK